MPSPTWSTTPEQTPIAAAVAAAVTEAWQSDARNPTEVFHDTLKRLLGAETYERVQFVAQDLWTMQADAPEGLEMPPSWAWFTMCPRCTKLKKTKYTQPQNGRVKLQVLRDPQWLAIQFEKGRSANEIGEKLGCTGSLVVDWAAKHGLLTPKAESQEEIEAIVRRMHMEGEAPGTIGRYLRENGHGYMQAGRVREVLSRLGLATLKNGQVYHDAGWWRERLVDRGMTAHACAKEAGIKSHAALYWVKKFGLEHVTKRNRKKGRKRKYPELYNEVQLRALLGRHGGNYEAAAQELGCSPSQVSRQARDLLGWEKRHHNHVPHSDKEWWTERLDRGVTTYELAEEAGIEEKSAREKCRLFGLLSQAYHNNAQRERERRKEAVA